MIALSCNKIKKEYGTDVVLSNISFAINEGAKVALIGANGVGKSTLFKILTKQLEPDGGDYYLNPDATVGYLAQNLNLDSDLTIYEEALKVFEPLKRLEVKMKKLEEAMATPWSPEQDAFLKQVQNDYSTAQALYDARGGFTYKGRLHRVLTGLSIPESTWDKPISVLSGGEKTRIALAKLLLSEPSIILMDEPTNHLDLAATEWLEEYLKAYKGTLLIISHDRYFLDAVTDHTYLMLQGEVLTYNASYSGYLPLHKAAFEARQKAYEAQQDEIARQEAIIEKYKQFNREKSIRAAESRQKRLDKMDRLAPPPKEAHSAGIRFQSAFQSGQDVLEAINLSKSFGDKNLFQGVNFKIRKGNKIALIGDNGRGKTTLFQIIRGKIPADTGQTILGSNVSVGYYDQEQANLNPAKTIMDEVWDDFPELNTTQLRTALGTYLFKGEEVFKEVKDLSGGEKCRINLLKLMLSQDNFLLLDEPTNHLDIPSREALEDSLLDYDGTLFVISHDRYFLNKVVSRIYELREHGIKEYLGNYSYYVEKRPEAPPKEKVEKAPSENMVIREQKKKNLKELRKMRLRLKEVEGDIETTEAIIEGLQEDLGKSEIFLDPEKLKMTNEAIAKNNQHLEDLMMEWEELASLEE